MSAVAAPPNAAPVTPPAPTAPVGQASPSTAGATWAWLVDVAGLGALGLVALSACGPAFGGGGYLAIGGLGLLAGMAVGLLLARRSVVLVALLTVVLYFVAGGPLTVPDRTVALVVPTPSSVSALADTAFTGVHNVLTTIVPLGSSTTLVGVPWLLGLLCGAVSMSIARRSPRWYLLAVVAPLAVLLLGIVMGTEIPAWSRQGAVFVCVALLWGSVRQRLARAGSTGSASFRRLPAAVLLLIVAALAGSWLASSTPVGGSRGRLVVRDQVEPPVDLRALPSPLEGFRSFRAEALRDEVMFEVDGAEQGDRFRLATLDSYDGVVWHVTTGDTSEDSSGFFQRVGEQISAAVEGEERSLTVDVVGYRGPWMLNLGSTEQIDFEGPDSGRLQDDVRHNLATGTSAVPSALGPGDRYELEAVVPDASLDGGGGEPDRSALGPELHQIEMVRQAAAELLGPSSSDLTPVARALAVQSVLRGASPDAERRGYFSDGREGEPSSLAGHGAARLTTFLDPLQGHIVGNEEQFASAMALLAASYGLPARVVVGFVPSDGAVEGGRVALTGDDISAWTEIAVDGVGWVPLDATPRDGEPPPDETPELKPRPRRQLEPPTTTTTIPAQSASGTGTSCEPECPEEPGPGLPAWVATAAKVVFPPLLLVGATTAILGGCKRVRRNRRRTSGSPSDQIAAGWAEVCDLATDLGDVVPPTSTRREAAVLLERPGVSGLARSADSLVFGPTDLDPDAAARYWQEVDLTRQAMLGQLSAFARWKALVNPSSLRLRRTRTGPPSSSSLPLDPRRLRNTVPRRT